MVRTYDTLQVPEQFGSIDTKTVDDALQEPKGRSKFLNRLSFNHHDSQKNKTNSKSSLTSDGEFSDDESYEEYNESKFSDYSETNDNSDFNYARKSDADAGYRAKKYDRFLNPPEIPHRPTRMNFRNFKNKNPDELDFPIDPYEAWTDGPQLRRECYTTQQLYYLTPRIAHLESRRIFIGDYPKNWVAKNCPQILKKIINRVNYAEEYLPHHDFPHYSPMGANLDMKDKPSAPNSSKYWQLRSERRNKDILMALEIGKNTNRAIESRRLRKRTMLEKERQYRAQLRKKSLKEVSNIPLNIEILTDNTKNQRENHHTNEIKSTLADSNKTHEETDLTDEYSDASGSRLHGTLSRAKTFPGNIKGQRPLNTSVSIHSKNSLLSENSSSRFANVNFDRRGTSKNVPAVPLNLRNEDDGFLEHQKLFGIGRSSLSDTSLPSAEFSDFIPSPQDLRKTPIPDVKVEDTDASLDNEGFDDADDDSSSFESFFDAQENFSKPVDAKQSDDNAPNNNDSYDEDDEDDEQDDDSDDAASVVHLHSASPECINASSDERSENFSALKGITPRKVMNLWKREVDAKNKMTSESEDDQIKNEDIKSIRSRGKKLIKSQLVKSISKKGFSSTEGSLADIPVSLSGDEKTIDTSIPVKPKPHRHHWVFQNITHKHRDLVYQGRFLVQERKVIGGFANFNGNFGNTPTSLVERWKEYAIFVRQTNDIKNPLVMYFYTSVKDKKLIKKSQRRWTHMLEFRIRIDPHYELSVFSGLDMTLALWKPSSKHLNRARFLVIQSPSTEDIIDLEYIVSAATTGTPPLRSPISLHVRVPALRSEVEVLSYRKTHELYSKWAENKLIGYSDLKTPTVGASEFLHEVNKNLWSSLAKSHPQRFSGKAVLAWIVDRHPHSPIWIPDSVAYLHPITRLARLMPKNSSLTLLQPVPRCFTADANSPVAFVTGSEPTTNRNFTIIEEPPPIEGYCNRVTFMEGSKKSTYLRTSDHYLFISPQSVAVPPFLSCTQDDVQKRVEPYELTEDGNDIHWIKSSTCLREVDYHDAMAFMEHERCVNGIVTSKLILDILYIDEFVQVSDTNVELKYKGNMRCALSFDNVIVTTAWCANLQAIYEYWKLRRERSVLASCDPVSSPCISPFVQNRSIVLSGPLYMKRQRMATFKICQVVLTPTKLVVYRPRHDGHISHPKHLVPTSSLVHRRYFVMDLHGSYVYDGPLAGHALLDNSYLDPNDPVSRSLPTAYDDGQTVRESEIDRCLVVWLTKRTKTGKLVQNSKAGQYVAFLAKNTQERDQWATAIRYVQKQLLATNELVNQQEQEEANLMATMITKDEEEINAFNERLLI